MKKLRFNSRHFFVFLLAVILSAAIIQVALAKRSNPPGPKGGAGTNWGNPPGPKGGPGSSAVKKDDKYWWKTATPYQKWQRSQLMERLEELKEYRSELMASGADSDLVEEVNEEIEEIEETLFG